MNTITNSNDSKFSKNERGSNYLLEIDNTKFVSYCARHPYGGSFECETADDETALKWDGKWAILNGDHREAVETAAPDVAAIVEVFRKGFSDGFRSHWSSIDSLEELA